MQDRTSFARLRAEGVASRGSIGWIRRVENPRDQIELAFAIGKRVGPAVERNRLRRRVRAVFSQLAAEGQIGPGIYLFGSHPRARDCTYSELTMELATLLARLNPESAHSGQRAASSPVTERANERHVAREAAPSDPGGLAAGTTGTAISPPASSEATS